MVKFIHVYIYTNKGLQLQQLKLLYDQILYHSQLPSSFKTTWDYLCNIQRNLTILALGSLCNSL